MTKEPLTRDQLLRLAQHNYITAFAECVLLVLYFGFGKPFEQTNSTTSLLMLAAAGFVSIAAFLRLLAAEAQVSLVKRMDAR